MRALLLEAVGRLRGRTALALGLASLVALLAAPAAGAAVPKVFWGIVPQSAQPLSHLQRAKKGGVDSERVSISWPSLQPTAGSPPNFSAFDQTVENASRAGLEVLPAIYGSPSWVSKPFNTLPVRTAKQRGAWSALLKAFVRRYGPQGSFWADNPGVPRNPIRNVQIWNEENFFYFVQRPSASQYGKLVKISHRAIASVSPGVKVILGGMFGLPANPPPKAYFASTFLSKMYRSTPGVRASFDGVALHPYTRSFKYVKPQIEAIRAVMRANGDGGKGLWITEMGWGSGHGNNSFEKGPKGQVRQLKGAFAMLRNNRSKWRIKRVYWFSLDDLPGACNFCGSTGLFGAGFKPKASWYAYAKFAGGNPSARVNTATARAFSVPSAPKLTYEHPAGWPSR
ncbi:MAG: glycosyl hydrolase [Solirubrobacterales bacterium]